MGEGNQPVRTTLEELRHLVALHGSMLFAVNALIPLYPLGRMRVDAVPPAGRPLSAAQVEAIITVATLGVAALFLPLYARQVITALQALRGGEAS